jgi:hypothetical protein
MARVAVDVLVGRVGIDRLRAAGHDVVAEAQPGEPDRDWFARACDRGVEFVIAADKDLSILCYDHRVEFFKAKSGHKGRVTAERFIQWHAARVSRRASP